MTTVFQQAVQLMVLALGFGFLREFAGIAAFEPAQDLVWKLLMSTAFIYLATRAPAMLGNSGTFDAWLHTIFFGMSLPGAVARSAQSIGLLAGGAAGGPAGLAAGKLAAGVAAGVAPCGGGPCRERRPLHGGHGDRIGRRRQRRPRSASE